ncbi:hypothetical protein P9139_14610 [Curtobacterium flaccumfaciens]|nr:hypothetical protein P9139_14610 [Curtobacterium flaccumfaciens]
MFVPAALLVLAVASGVVTATVDASTRSFLQDSGRVEFGAALRADLGGSLPLDGPSDLVPERVRGRQALDHGVRPVLRLTGTPGDAAQSVATVQVVGLDAAALPTMLPVSSETFDADRAVRGLRSALPGVELGAGTASGRPRSLDIGVRTAVASATRTVLGPDGSATVTGPVADADTRLRAVGWLVDEVGDIAPVTTSETAVRTGAGVGVGVGAGEATLSATLPSGGPWRLAALDLRLRGDADLSDLHVDVRSVTVGGAAVDLPDRRWSLATGAYDASGLRASDDARLGVTATTLGLAAQPGSTVGARLMPTADRVVPVVASTATGASRGDSVTLNGTWSSFRGRVVGTVPTVPGTNGGPAYLADLPTLDQGVLAGSQRPQRIREVWASDGGARSLLAATLPGSPSPHRRRASRRGSPGSSSWPSSRGPPRRSSAQCSSSPPPWPPWPATGATRPWDSCSVASRRRSRRGSGRSGRRSPARSGSSWVPSPARWPRSSWASPPCGRACRGRRSASGCRSWPTAGSSARSRWSSRSRWWS